VRGTVRISFCSPPLSPNALRAALMRLVSVEADTIRPPPDRSDEIVLADDALAVLHQVDQEVEHLRLDGNALDTAAQLATVGIKRMIVKEKLHVAPQTALRSRSQEIIKPVSRTNHALGKVFRPRSRHSPHIPQEQGIGENHVRCNAGHRQACQS
jgi:hypothetical protein